MGATDVVSRVCGKPAYTGASVRQGEANGEVTASGWRTLYYLTGQLVRTASAPSHMQRTYSRRQAAGNFRRVAGCAGFDYALLRAVSNFNLPRAWSSAAAVRRLRDGYVGLSWWQALSQP